MKYQPKVEQVETHQGSQSKPYICKGKLKLLRTDLYPDKGDLAEVTKRGGGNSNEFFISIAFLSGRKILPIIISETEEIQEEDWFLNTTSNTIHKATHIDNNIQSGTNSGEYHGIFESKKILVRPEHFSPKQLEAIADGKMGEGNEVSVKCRSCVSYESNGPDLFWHVVYLDQHKYATLFSVIDKEHEQLVTIFRLLDELQDKYQLNKFSPVDIKLWKNGDMLFASVQEEEGELMLEQWKLKEFKDSKIY